MSDARGEIIGDSDVMRELRARIKKLAQSDFTVLILGESGVGKELVARRVHAESPRSNHPLVSFNCGAVKSELAESELFGHVKGAFTGASESKPGLIEAAEKGTLFIDEIGEMPASMQVMLLRVLQEKKFRRVGQTAERSMDVRIIAATNQDLKQLVRDGAFREDLLGRLDVLRLRVPALRDRLEDVPALVTHFLSRHGNRPLRCSSATLAALRAYPWPRNVRQLENTIIRTIVELDEATECIEPSHLVLGRVGASASLAAGGDAPPPLVIIAAAVTAAVDVLLLGGDVAAASSACDDVLHGETDQHHEVHAERLRQAASQASHDERPVDGETVDMMRALRASLWGAIDAERLRRILDGRTGGRLERDEDTAGVRGSLDAAFSKLLDEKQTSAAGTRLLLYTVDLMRRRGFAPVGLREPGLLTSKGVRGRKQTLGKHLGQRKARGGHTVPRDPAASVAHRLYGPACLRTDEDEPSLPRPEPHARTHAPNVGSGEIEVLPVPDDSDWELVHAPLPHRPSSTPVVSGVVKRWQDEQAAFNARRVLLARLPTREDPRAEYSFTRYFSCAEPGFRIGVNALLFVEDHVVLQHRSDGVAVAGGALAPAASGAFSRVDGERPLLHAACDELARELTGELNQSSFGLTRFLGAFRNPGRDVVEVAFTIELRRTRDALSRAFQEQRLALPERFESVTETHELPYLFMHRDLLPRLLEVARGEKLGTHSGLLRAWLKTPGPHTVAAVSNHELGKGKLESKVGGLEIGDVLRGCLSLESTSRP